MTDEGVGLKGCGGVGWSGGGGGGELKGQSNEIFDTQFFSSFEPAWATDQWVKIVLFLVSFSPRYSNFYEAPRSIILRGVKFCAVGIILRGVI